MSNAVLAVLVLVLGGVLGRFGEQLFDALMQLIGRVRGSRRKTLTGHFRGVPLDELDLLVFTVTVRTQVPITDALYFEFVRHLLLTGQARKAVLVIWYPTPLDGSGEMDAFRDYLAGTFRDVSDRLTVLDGPEVAKAAQGPIPPRFWSALRQLSSPEYYAWIRASGLRVRRLKHMNQARPGEEVLRGMVAHAIHNSYVLPSIIEELEKIGRGRNDVLSLGVLFWEVEADRMAVYYDLYDKGEDLQIELHDFHLHPISGRTISGRFRKAGDNHDRRAAIVLRKDPAEQVDVIQSKPRREVRAYVRALNCVLVENYKVTSSKRLWAAEGRRVLNNHLLRNRQNGRGPKVRRSTLELIYALSLVRQRVYGRQPSDSEVQSSTVAAVSVDRSASSLKRSSIEMQASEASADPDVSGPRS